MQLHETIKRIGNAFNSYNNNYRVLFNASKCNKQQRMLLPMQPYTHSKLILNSYYMNTTNLNLLITKNTQ